MLLLRYLLETLKLGVCIQPFPPPLQKKKKKKRKKLCPFFDLLYEEPYSRALAPACGGLVEQSLWYQHVLLFPQCFYPKPISSTLPFPRRQMLDSSKLKEFADDNFKFDGSVIMSSNWLEKHWEKEKLLITSNFSFPQCFHKTCTAYM